MSRRKELADYFMTTNGVIVRGEVQLSSGVQSDYYINMSEVFGTSAGEDVLIEAFIERIHPFQTLLMDKDHNLAIGGPELKAVGLAASFRTHLRRFLLRDIDFYTVRKHEKTHGLMKLVEGPARLPGSDCIIIEDVTTTGNAILYAMDVLYDLHCNIVAVVPIVDRGDGSIERLVMDKAMEMSVKLQAAGQRHVTADVEYLPILYAADLGRPETPAGRPREKVQVSTVQAVRHVPAA